jgi:hypothetical protein
VLFRRRLTHPHSYTPGIHTYSAPGPDSYADAADTDAYTSTGSHCNPDTGRSIAVTTVSIGITTATVVRIPISIPIRSIVNRTCLRIHIRHGRDRYNRLSHYGSPRCRSSRYNQRGLYLICGDPALYRPFYFGPVIVAPES